MSLSPGQRVGSHEVVARVGAGGMGEVYRAREAQTLAALNHPNIAQIYGVEDSGTIHALVMARSAGGQVDGPC